MAQFFETIPPAQVEFIRQQPVFFVATGARDGRINCSPKGMDTLRVLNDRTVAYLDLTGSGAETSAHVQHDGRMTMMFCSFADKPLILRLYGRGENVRPIDPAWADLIAHFTPMPGQRQIIVLHVESVQTSCGFAVPRMELIEPRSLLVEHAAKKGEAGLTEYRAKKNAVSIDGLPNAVVDDAAD
jgi:hypothetical protein